jgi:transcriptional regulator with PAS, ATPase and Fis domain
VELVGPRRCTVLITGETGTGKEVAARAIHAASDRAHLPMVAVNCSAIPEQLLESELFGHTKGAFTGAAAPRTGRFEQANNSTLFLDEIGDLPLELQAKLLRVLQERELQRLGSSETVKLNVRVIAATNRNLSELVREGKFREDLYYRLNVVALPMPPLRDRLQDIPALVRHFVERICQLERIAVKRAGDEVLNHLQSHSWPGNIRELENMVERAVVMSGLDMELHPDHFPLPSLGRRVDRENLSCLVPDSGLDFAQAVASFEAALMDQALLKAGGNKTAAAELLRMKRTTLVSKLRAFECNRFPKDAGPKLIKFGWPQGQPQPANERPCA